MNEPLTPERRAELRQRLARRSGPSVLVWHGHLLALLDAADEADKLRAQVERVERVRALAEEWRYKGEFGWGAWQEGHGPDHEGWVLDGCASDIRRALDGTDDYRDALGGQL